MALVGLVEFQIRALGYRPGESQARGNHKGIVRIARDRVLLGKLRGHFRFVFVGQLQRGSYGQYSKNQKELGDALRLAGVRQVRKNVNGSKRRFYELSQGVEPDEPTAF